MIRDIKERGDTEAAVAEDWEAIILPMYERGCGLGLRWLCGRGGKLVEFAVL
jgi:hypothetical protein